MRRNIIQILISILFFGLLLSACQPADINEQTVAVSIETTATQEDTPTPTITRSATAPVPTTTATILPTATETVTPTPSPSPTATTTPTPTTTNTPTATPMVSCDERNPVDDLLVLISKDYAISKDFEPSDLVPLADYLPYQVTSGYPTQIREIIADPLTGMIGAMQEEGLYPRIESGYRSFVTQAIAWDKWNREYPETAAIVSARPGRSEHQLGTVVDFGSPELAGIVGQEDIEFHTYFYKTSEGQWLKEHAHEYGFTLSFSLEAFETTGLYYEPWHFRYVGEEMAMFLHEEGVTLTEYMLEKHGEPCIP